ncbi:MAG: glutathione S-transferase [Cycloclasticus sp.]|nr:glutathione S-transferase [Cycloclasticus sp.]MBG96077.1 glutathione S-transferase [Cycloclasticus sp.]HAI97377.1 glutathione S-transferase family protein [Methylococcaceae bacterium]
MIKLYGYPRSRSTRVVWMLEELGIDYEFIKIELLEGEGQTADYLKIHADGKVPAIDDEGFVLTESAAIVTYLGDKYPAQGLIPPAGTQQRAKYDEGCFFILTELEQPLWTIGKHTFVFPEDKRVPAILDVARWEFLKACKALEKNLSGKKFALGDQFSAVDILLAHTLRWADAFGVASGSQVLDDYRDRMSARPSFAKVISREAAVG